MPALDIEMVSRLGHDLHSTTGVNGLMNEGEVCPWTLFLTMALTLLKGVLPHVPRMLPVFISDPELRSRAAETFESEEFKNNIEEYFVQNIKTDIQTPLNRQIIRSSETVMYAVDILNNLVATFLGPDSKTGDIVSSILNGNKGIVEVDNNDLGKTDDKPRSLGGNFGQLGQMFQFAKTLYNLA